MGIHCDGCSRLITSNGRVPTGRRWGCRRCRVVGHVGVDLEFASGVTREGHCFWVKEKEEEGEEEEEKETKGGIELLVGDMMDQTSFVAGDTERIEATMLVLG